VARVVPLAYRPTHSCYASTADRQLTGRYVANWPRNVDQAKRKAEVRAELTKRLDVKRPDIRAGDIIEIPLSNILD
jgi:hypothetical protein